MKIIIKIIFLIFAFTIYSKANNEIDARLLIDILLIRDANSISTDLIYQDAVNLGYHVDIVIPESLTIEIVNQHRLVILSTGNNPTPCTSNNMRTILTTFADDGGKLIIEGGQNGYVASVFPLYPAFKNKVLQLQSWTADNGGNLIISSNHAQSALATVPNILPGNIEINFNNIYDQDVCVKGEFSELFYKTSSYETNVGILVAPNVTSPQIINYCFNYSSVSNRTYAKNLMTNSIYNLIGSPVGINNNGEEIPTEFKLHQNYPNPFNPNTVINYQLASGNYVSLKVYDVLGNEITTLVNKKQNAGSYDVIWNASDFSSGIYLYSLSLNGSLFETKKMFLLK